MPVNATTNWIKAHGLTVIVALVVFFASAWITGILREVPQNTADIDYLCHIENQDKRLLVWVIEVFTTADVTSDGFLGDPSDKEPAVPPIDPATIKDAELRERIVVAQARNMRAVDQARGFLRPAECE